MPVLPSPPPAMGSGGATSDGLEFDFPSGNKYDAQGNIIKSNSTSLERYYPVNDGFDNAGYEILELKKNTVLARYGDEAGYFLTDPKTPESFLNLPGGTKGRVYNEYIVKKPFTVKYGGVNGSLGGSSTKQYLSPNSIEWLLNNKYLIIK